MSNRFLASVPALMAVAAIFALTPEHAAGQATKSAAPAKSPKSAAASTTWTQAKTPWGDPEIQGTWTSDDCIGTPLQRPANFGDRLYFTEQELAQRQGAIERQQKTDLVDTVGEGQRVGTGPPAHWGERARRPCTQTSLIVEPSNGKMPDMLPEAKLRPVPEGAGNATPKADSWEDFTFYIRCITRGVPGSIFPVIYGNGQQIVQAKGFVTILQEMVHEARVIPVDGSPHTSSNIRTYMGDARGHWEGNTLVVETTNFIGNRTGLVGNGGGTPTSDALKTTERFTRFSPDQMKYEITIEDPKTFAKPFKVSFPLTQEPGYQNFEYACHEGNNAMFNSLSAARAKEKAAAKK